ncbi:MAG: ankyrin repeat domain-containing protein [Planctomycetota bacterium]|jgi:cytohesin
MKISLSLKLGIFVVLLFVSLAAACFLWTPLRMQYYVSCYRSDDARKIARGIRGLFSMGDKGASELERFIRDELEHDPSKHIAMVANALISDKPKGVELLAKILAGGAEEAAFLEKHWTGFDQPVKGDFEGRYPLFIAAEEDRKDAAVFLIARGADVNLGTYRGTAPLHRASEEGNKEVVEILLKNGADVNAKIVHNFTALHLASIKGLKEIGLLLIKYGADVNAKDNYGLTPLHHAASYNHTDMALLLIEKGADIKAENQYGAGPLHWAASNGHKEMVELLVENGADLNAHGNASGTPLHLAARGGHRETVLWLLEKGVDVNAKKYDNMTPLHMATYNGHLRTAVILIENGANVNARNNKNRTPLHLAAINGHRPVIVLLHAKRADLNALDNTGLTALDWVADEKSIEYLSVFKGKRGEELPGGTPFNKELREILVNYKELLRIRREIVSSIKKNNHMQVMNNLRNKTDEMRKNKILLEKYIENNPDDPVGKELMEMVDRLLGP